MATNSRRLAFLCALLGLVISWPGATGDVPLIDPQYALGTWDFNNAAAATQSADSVFGTVMTFQAATAYSVDAAGRSGLSGDRAINFGTVAGNSARVNDAAFMALLNQSNTQNNQLSVVFWQRWSTPVANSSSVWFTSPAGANRGWQTHLPYSDNTVYFDTSGCCVAPAQRLTVTTGSVTSLLPGFSWQAWNHIALVKNGAAKQIWINGQKVAEQTSGVSALVGDWTELTVGAQPGGSNSLKGLIDDFAIFATALQQSQIAALAAGSSPSSLVDLTQRPPQFTSLTPADGTSFHPPGSGLGFTVTTVSPNILAPANIRLFLNGTAVPAGSLSIGGTTTNRTVAYTGSLELNRYYIVRAEVSDNAARASSQTWTFDTADPSTTPSHKKLDIPSLGSAVQSTTLSAAAQAYDGNSATVSETTDQAGSFWELELERTVRVSRIYLVAPTGTGYDGVLNGLRVRVYNLRDQLVYETTISGVAAGGTWAAFLPPTIDGRIVRIDLPDGQTNGAGDYRIALAEVQAYGDPSPAVGPLDLVATATATQSSTTGTYTASLAIDGNAGTYSETNDVTDSHWLLTLDRSRPVRRIELVNRSDANATRMGGLTLRLLDANSITLATATVTDPGAGGTWGFDVPTGTGDARFIRVGLEGGALNGQGNRIVSLAGVSVLTGVNYALGTPSYMLRLTDTLPSPSLANDGDHATHTETTTRTVDAYWETDLGTTRSLYSVRVVALDNGDNQIRLRHATLRLYDENHESIYSKHLSGTSAIFDIALPGPVQARYVRVGFENKERSHLTGGIEWWLRIREVQAFGRPPGESGLTSFAAAPTQITAGQSTNLTWQHEGLRELTLYPGIGSVGSYVNSQGAGTLAVSPATTTEYVLVGRSGLGNVARYVTVQVNGQPLPPRIGEFVASNRLSFKDGYNDASDWIELRNPNNTTLDLSGYGLSDNPSNPMKWVFPGGASIPAHGFLIVFASGRNTALDPAGYYHTSFNLSASGESVVLTAPDGVTTVDSILNFPAQEEDLAYGRAMSGATGFLVPTPSALNLTDTLTGWLLPPLFSHSRGFHDTPFSLTISNPNAGADLFYSLNGSEPNLPYTGPIAVNGSVTVRATVRRTGYHSPRTQTSTYIFRDSVMASPLMNTTYTQGALATRLRDSLTQLPSICLSVPQLPDDYNEREASLEVFLPDGSPPLQLNAGLNRVGGAWTVFDKKSYRVSFRPEYGTKKLQTPLLRGFDRGMPVLDEIDTLDLSAGNHDMKQRGFYMANRFVEDTMLEMGSLNPHGRFVHVYVNGIYWGQYNAHERLEDSFLAGYLGGKTEDYVNVKGNDNDGANFVLGDPEAPNREPWETVRANRSSYTAIKDQVDVPQLIDFMLLWYYGNAESEFRCAGPIAPGSGFKFWLADADGFLRTAALTLNTTGNTGPGGIFGALVTEGHPDFKMLLADRIYKHFFHNGAMTPERNLARLNARMAEVRDSMIAECARWGYISNPNPRTPTNWESDAETIRTGLFPLRTSNLFTLLRNGGRYPTVDPPVLSQHGGSVSQGYYLSLTSATGTICYTLDGSDPRLPGGAVSPSATAAAITSTTHVGLTLNQNTNLKARFLSDTTWSALADVTFHVAHPLLATGPYVLHLWNATEAAGTYPSNMRFFQTDVLDPGLAAAMDTPWTRPYHLTSRSRINGLGTDGIAFINTDNVQDPGAGYVGAAVLAVNTTGTQDIRVTWTGGTVEPNERVYGIRLQYRIGDSGAFTDVLDASNNPVEYLRNATQGHSAVIGPVTLPQAAENQPLVELRWKYYHHSGEDGKRAQLRLDNIQVTAGPVVAQSLAMTGAPGTAQADSVAGPVNVEVRGRNNAVAESYNGTVTVSLAGFPGLIGGTTSRQAVNGHVTFDDLVFPDPGSYTLTISASGLSPASHTVATQVVGMSELVMPRYIQGTQPTNNQRVPFAFLVRLEGLLPGATYRYANQIVNDDDSRTQEGAGNMILARNSGNPFVRCTESPRFLPADLDIRHGEFVADGSGRHTGWFVTEPSGNVRFTPGSTLRARILLNDGGGGDVTAHFLTATAPLQVLPFGTGPADGSAVYGTSAATAKNFLLLYDDSNGATRPLAATPVEATAAAVDSQYALFYQTMVAGQGGRWGTIVPNQLAAGVMRVEERDLLTGNVVSAFADPAGILPTADLANGTNPVGLRIPATGASHFARWQSRLFSLAQLDAPAVGGPLGDADLDGIGNLLEFAFGMDPFQQSVDGLPATAIETLGGTPYLVFRHRRLLGNHGLQYAAQVSTDAVDWQDAAGAWTGAEETAPNPDGITETVTRRLQILPSIPRRFLRMSVRVP